MSYDFWLFKAEQGSVIESFNRLGEDLDEENFTAINESHYDLIMTILNDFSDLNWNRFEGDGEPPYLFDIDNQSLLMQLLEEGDEELILDIEISGNYVAMNVDSESLDNPAFLALLDQIIVTIKNKIPDYICFDPQQVLIIESLSEGKFIEAE